MLDSAFTERMVPFYLRCLLEVTFCSYHGINLTIAQNSSDGRLNVIQLRLAFAILVKSASLTRDAALAWLCVNSILTACKELSQDVNRRHRLHLALISSLPSLPLALLPQALSAVRDVIDGTPDDASRKELVEALFQEIMENIGDAEKEYAVHWWDERRIEWSVAGLGSVVRDGEHLGTTPSETVPRL